MKQDVAGAPPSAVPFVPYRSLAERAAKAPKHARHYLEPLINQYNQRTPTSKALTQQFRAVVASNRNITGLTPALKEATYQVIATRASGAYFWDVDGQPYLDLTMGFGALLLGHRHPTLEQALHAQLEATWSVGPISEHLGRAAQGIAELTGQERVAFFNSGSEAVMVAIRLARAVSGRRKLVLFAGAYHGMFDGVLAVGAPGQPPGTSQPMAPGVPPSLVEDTLILPYGDPESLDFIERHADELAAVLVEPVQSRRPDLQPRAFLKRLRTLTQQQGVALIFDELVTGFRVAQGGAQAWFGVQADLTTYGKTLGGGMPLGVVAGTRLYMDALDGGYWQFGDDSFPTSITTFTAGTFNAHPLTLAGVLALLEVLKTEGPALQRQLSARTRLLCARMNGIFADKGLPIHVVQFASMFRFEMPSDYTLFFHWMVTQGVYVWELRGCFLSTAHSDADLERLLELTRAASDWLSQHLPPPPPSYQPGVKTLPASRVQAGMYERNQRLPHDAVYHVSTAYRVKGALDLVRLESALQELTLRHETLRTSFHQREGQVIQRIHPVSAFELSHTLCTEAELPAFLAHLRRGFELTLPGLLRCAVAELGPQSFVLALDVHHLVVDGLSMDVLMHELFELYLLRDLKPPGASYQEYLAWETAYHAGAQFQLDEQFWMAQLGGDRPRTELVPDVPPPPEQEGLDFCLRFELQQPEPLRACARRFRVTQNMLLNALFQVFLAKTTGQHALCYGSPSAGRPSAAFQDTVGLFIGVIVHRLQLSPDQSFVDLLEQNRERLPSLLAAQHFPFGLLAQRLDPTPGRMPIFDIGFSYEASQRRGTLQLDTLELEPMPLQPRGVLMNVVLECVDDGTDFRFRLIYNPRRYHRETVQGWIQTFEALCQRLTRVPERPLSEVLSDIPQ